VCLVLVASLLVFVFVSVGGSFVLFCFCSIPVEFSCGGRGSGHWSL